MAGAEVTAVYSDGSVADDANVENKTDNAHEKSRPHVVYHRVIPHLIVQAPKAAEAIQFYQKAFDVKEVNKSLHPKRKVDQEFQSILFAHLKFGDAELIICDEAKEAGPMVKSSPKLSGTEIILHLETSDVDAAFARAIEAGADVREEIAVQPWGQCYGKLRDPFGFVWSIATPIQKLTETSH